MDSEVKHTQRSEDEPAEPARQRLLRSFLIFLALVLTLLGSYVAAAIWDTHRRILPNGYEVMRESSGNCTIVKGGRLGVHDIQGRLVLDEYVASWRVRGDIVWGRVRFPPFGETRVWATRWYMLDTRSGQAQLFDSKAELWQQMPAERS